VSQTEPRLSKMMSCTDSEKSREWDMRKESAKHDSDCAYHLQDLTWRVVDDDRYCNAVRCSESTSFIPLWQIDAVQQLLKTFQYMAAIFNVSVYFEGGNNYKRWSHYFTNYRRNVVLKENVSKQKYKNKIVSHVLPSSYSHHLQTSQSYGQVKWLTLSYSTRLQ